MSQVAQARIDVLNQEVRHYKIENQTLREEIYNLRVANHELVEIVRLYAEMGHHTAKQYIANLEGRE